MKQFQLRVKDGLYRKLQLNRELFAHSCALKSDKKYLWINLTSDVRLLEFAEFIHHIQQEDFEYSDSWRSSLEKFGANVLTRWSVCLNQNKCLDWRDIKSDREQKIQTSEYFPICSSIAEPLKQSFVSDLPICSWFPEDFTYRDIAVASGCATPVIFQMSDIETSFRCIDEMRKPNCFIALDENSNPSIVHTTGNPDYILLMRPSFSLWTKLTYYCDKRQLNPPIILKVDQENIKHISSISKLQLFQKNLIGFHVDCDVDSTPSYIPSTPNSFFPSRETTPYCTTTTVGGNDKSTKLTWLTSLFASKQKYQTELQYDQNITRFEILLNLLEQLSQY